MQYKYLKSGLDIDDPEEKSICIIYELIKQTDYISIDDLADQLALDRRSISKSIASKENYLQLYSAKVIGKQGKGIKICFKNEAMILLLLRNIMTLKRNYIDSDRFKTIYASLDKKFTDKTKLKEIILNILVLEKIRNCHGQVEDKMPFLSLCGIKKTWRFRHWFHG